MTLKMKLTSTIAAFLLILGLTIMGVMAAPSATVNLGGSISFTATGVNAKVTGSVADYGNDTEPELKEILFQAEYTDTEKTAFDEAIDSWKNCDLVFKSTGSAITITVTIENLADRVLFASVNSTLDVDNVNQSMAQGEDEYTGDIIEIGAKGTTEVDLILEVDNKNASVSGNWGFDIDLMDVNGINSQNISNLSFTVLDEAAKTASVSMKSIEATSGDIVIPSYVIINPETGAASAASATSASENLYKVTKIAEYAFIDTAKAMEYYQECLTYLQTNGTLPNGSVPTSEEEIYSFIFSKYAAPITSVTIQNGITSIDQYAFYYCTQLSQVVLPDSLTTIGNRAFQGCSALTSEKLKLGKGLTTLGEGAFINCTGLTNIIIPDSVETLQTGAFAYCYELTNVTIGKANIGARAFEDCTKLVEVKIGSGATSIEVSAFAGCSKLENITIPDTLKTIGDNAFKGCSNLASVRVEAIVVPTLGGANAFSNCSSELVIEVPSASLELYKAAEYWQDLNLISY